MGRGGGRRGRGREGVSWIGLGRGEERKGSRVGGDKMR